MKILAASKKKPPAWIHDRVAPRLASIEAAIGRRFLRRGKDVAPPFACGVYGCVFAIEGDETRVVKITEDRHEGAYTEYVRTLQQNKARTTEGPVLSVTVRVDGVWRLVEDDPKFETKPIFVIVEERVQPHGSCKVSSRLLDAANVYTDGWDKVAETADLMSDLLEAEDLSAKEQKKLQAEAASEYAEAGELIAKGIAGLRRSGPEGRAVAAFLTLVHGEGFPLTDMHQGNLCRRLFAGPDGAVPGQLVVIDFGVSEAGSPWPRSVKRLGSASAVGETALLPGRASGLGPTAYGSGPTKGIERTLYEVE